MKIKCKGITGEALSPKTLQNIYKQSDKFNKLKLNKIYIPYGICISKGTISYFIIDENNSGPFWYPGELFIVCDNLFPLIFYYNFFGNNQNIEAIWGFKELVADSNFHVDLTEGKEKATKIFLNRKAEIDEYANLRCYNK